MKNSILNKELSLAKAALLSLLFSTKTTSTLDHVHDNSNRCLRTTWPDVYSDVNV